MSLGKEKPPGRYKPTYEPSGHGTYNCRWRREERRRRVAERQERQERDAAR